MQSVRLKKKKDRLAPIFGCLWPFWVGGLMIFFFSRDPYLTENGYSTSLYPLLTQVTTVLGGFLPASIAELTFVAGTLFAVVMALRFALSLRSTPARERGDRLFDAAVLCVRTAAFVFLAFAVLCAPNYYRQSFTVYSGHVTAPGTVDELEGLSTLLGERAGALRPSVQENAEGRVLLTAANIYDVAREARTVMASLAEAYPILAGTTPAPKPVVFSFVLNRLGLTGFYFPYFNEPNFNVSMPAADMPFTMLHELAHAHGFMREDEANFIAYLACRAAENPDFAYSGHLNALRYCLNALAGADGEAYRRVWEALPDKVRGDVEYTWDYWAAYDGALSDMSESVNDLYLKANNQTDGTQSYSRVVQLLLAEYRLTAE